MPQIVCAMTYNVVYIHWNKEVQFGVEWYEIQVDCISDNCTDLFVCFLLHFVFLFDQLYSTRSLKNINMHSSLSFKHTM